MPIKRNKLYTLLLISCTAGYLWLYYGISSIGSSVEVCLIKNTTGVPCPSCGSTRAVISLAKGDFFGSIFTNPLGLVIALILLIAPIWILFDLIARKKTLLSFYILIENYLKKPKVLIVLFILIALNWVWNITKGL